MAKLILGFLILFAVFFFGIQTFRSLKRKQKLGLAKLIAYSGLCAGLAILLMTLIVVLF